MVLAPGSMLIITEEPEVGYVTVKKNFGYRKDQGWLLYTEEGNYIFVNIEEESAGL